MYKRQLIDSFGDGIAFDSTVCFIKLSSLSERIPSSTLLCSSCNCSLTSASFSLDASLAFLVRWPSSTHLQWLDLDAVLKELVLLVGTATRLSWFLSFCCRLLILWDLLLCPFASILSSACLRCSSSSCGRNLSVLSSALGVERLILPRQV